METWFQPERWAQEPFTDNSPSPCDGCEHFDRCAQGEACRVYLNWLDTGFITSLNRKPTAESYRAAFQRR